jgi:hypothetical protein
LFGCYYGGAMRVWALQDCGKGRDASLFFCSGRVGMVVETKKQIPFGDDRKKVNYRCNCNCNCNCNRNLNLNRNYNYNYNYKCNYKCNYNCNCNCNYNCNYNYKCKYRDPSLRSG